jgi:4-amino-4-deoxy-L-arabinose transferase-like glycosyltransferase
LITKPRFLYSNNAKSFERTSLTEPTIQGRATGKPVNWIEILILAAVLVVAVVFRLWDLSARNLWTDEAWVALAALAPTPREALTLGRSTPPFYMLSLWGLVQVFGGGEAVLRVLSLGFGVGVVALFGLAARRLVSPGAARVGLVLVALSPALVYFSKEVKQYSGDAFFAVLAVWLAERLREHPDRAAPWLTLALAGPLALGFSHGAVFVLPAVLVVLWLEMASPQRRRVLWLGAFWAVAAALFFVFFYRRQVDPELVAYWAGDYPDFSGLIPFLTWLGSALARYFHYFFHYFFAPSWGWLWGVGFAALGVLAAARGGPRHILIYWGGPLLLTLMASALHRYPFMGHFNGSRLFLFSAPWLYLLASLGLAAVFSRLWQGPRRWPAPALAALILWTTQPLALVQENLQPQTNRQELKPVARYLSAHLRPGDLVYVYYHAIFPFKYYFRGNPEGVRWGKSCVETALDLTAGGSEAPRRVWLVAAHFRSLVKVKHFAARLLGEKWQEKEMLAGQNAALFLFVPQDRSGANYPDSRVKSLRSRTLPPLSGKAW